MFRRRQSNMKYMLPAVLISALVGAAVFFLIPRIRGSMQEGGMIPQTGGKMGRKNRVSGGYTQGIVDQPGDESRSELKREGEIMDDASTRTFDL